MTGPGALFRRMSLPALGEPQRFLLLSILIGLFSGLLVVCFHVAIASLSWAALGTGPDRGILRTLLSPMLGAVAATLLVLFFFRMAAGSGVNHTKAAIYISDGYIPFSAVTGKFLACSISIGSGNSLGPEDPALQIGSGIASLLGRIFRLTRESMRLIAPVGAAAGIAAAFNTPITGVLFVMEQVVASWRAGVLGSILLSAVSAVVVSRFFLGDQPLFEVPGFELTHPSELLVYAGMGIAGGLLAVLFMKAVALLREKTHHLPQWARYARPGAAGLMVGVAGIWLPEVMGAGYGAIDSALHDQLLWPRLLVLGFVKMLVTLLCFSAGIPGGMFAPALFIGAMIGGGIGALAHLYWPFPTSAASAYVLVGMGTFFAGVFRAPMTSIFMVFEVSASYVIILPVMISNTIAYLISRSLAPLSFFDMIARHEGVDLPSLEEHREKRDVRVEDAMRIAAGTALTAQTLVSSAIEQLRAVGRDRTLVSRGNGMWSTVSLDELTRAALDGKGANRLGQVVPFDLVPRLYPDMAVDTAMKILARHRMLPVTSRANPDALLGTVTLDDILRSYGHRIKPESGGPDTPSQR